MPRVTNAHAFTLAQLLLLGGCVNTDLPQFRMLNPTFNDRIRADFTPLTPEDAMLTRERLGYGFFRDGTGGGFVNELYPVTASNPTPGGFGTLVQTPCLFVGAERRVDGGLSEVDALNASWELVALWQLANPDDVSAVFRELAQGAESDMNLGMCSLSTPVRRRLFDKPKERDDTLGGNAVCDPDGNTSDYTIPLTISDQPNISNECVAGHFFHEMLLEAAPRGPGPGEQDGTCPVLDPHNDVARFEGTAVELPSSVATGWRHSDEPFSVCGYRPNLVTPTGDVSYRIRLKPGHSFGGGGVSRWLAPTVLKVEGHRTIARPMKAPEAAMLPWRWKTRSVDIGETQNPLPRWDENFSPTVQVREVEIESRDAFGGAMPVRPDDGILRFSVPRPTGPATVVLCTLPNPDVVRFTLAAHCVRESGDGTIKDALELTPTYSTAYLHQTPAVVKPVEWSANLSLPTGRSAYIRFFLEAKAYDPHMRSTGLLDFGRLKAGGWNQRIVRVENVGGRRLRVRQVGFGAGSAHPSDFRFVVAGDPVQVPLPLKYSKIEGQDGVYAVELDSSLEEAGLLVVKTEGDALRVSLGDPERGSHAQPVTVYGEPARFEGSLLLREDPAGTFPSVTEDRPFSLTARTEKTLPFDLAPGESVDVVVITEPSAVGVRSALLRVEAEPVGVPGLLWTQSLLRVESVQGGLLRGTPGFLWFNREGGSPDQGSQRTAMIENAGALDLDVTQIRLEGPDAARFSFASSAGGPPLRLSSAAAADIRVTYTPHCDGTYGTPTSLAEHRATLVIASTGGNIDLPLQGSSYGFCELP
jgi:hypothetical protein